MLSGSQRTSLQAAAERYAAALPSSGTAMDYLNARGISEEVASTYLLGYVEEPVIGHDEFKNWLCIPFVTPSGVVALKFRRIAGDANPKYLSDGDSRLYNVGALHRSS